MKKKNILLSVLTGFVALATLVSCGSKKKNNTKDTTTTQDTTTSTNTNTTSTTITSTNTNTTSDTQSGTTTTTEDASHTVVTKEEFFEAVKDYADHPQELGYTGAQVQYSITKDGSTSNGTWSYTYNTETEKWVGADEDAQAAQYDHYILNYSITSRIGNPFATLTFYVDPYAVYETTSDTTSYFEWDEEGKIVTFEANGWYWGDNATFTYSWSK